MSDASPAKPAQQAGPQPVDAPAESPFRTASGRGVFLGGGAGWNGARRRALIVLAAGLVLTAGIVSLLVSYQRAKQENTMDMVAVRHATDLHNHLTGAVAALYTSVTWVLEGNGQVPNFEHYADVLLHAYRGVLGLDLAPDAVVQHVVPERLLGPLKGRNLLHEPALSAAASGATASRNLYFGEPALLATNTPAITARLPVLLRGNNGAQGFWGLVGAYIGLDDAVRAARIDQLPALGYRYSLVTLGADDVPATRLSGEGTYPADATRQAIHLPGLTLQLAIWPRASAASVAWILLLALPGIAISLLAAAFVGALGQTRQANASALRALADSGRAGERFSRLLASFPDAVILTKPDGRIVAVNETTESLCGYTRSELLGRPLGLLLPAADAGAEGDQPGLQLGVTGGLLPVRHKEGRQFAVLVQVGRLAGDGGEDALLCHVLRRPDRAASAEALAETAAPSAEEVFQASPVAQLLLDEELQIAEANLAAAGLLGVRSREVLTRRRVTEFVPAVQEDGSESQTLITRQADVCQRDGAAAFDLTLEINGQAVPVAVSLVRLSGEPVRLLAVLERRPESDEAERRLADVETQLLAVTDGLRDWEAWIGLEGQPLWVGGPVQNFTGYSATECLAMSDYPFPLIHEDDRGRVREALLSALQGTSGSHLEFRVTRKDGQIRRVAMSWRPTLDRRRRPLGYRTSIRDVAHARAAEPGPLSEEKRDTLELALEGAEIGVWDWDLASGRNMWDERMLRLFELTPAEFAQSHDAWRRRLHPDDVDRVETAIQAALEEVGSYEVEHRIVLPDGRERSLASRGHLLRDASGKPERLIGVTWDITPLRQTEEAIRHDQALLRSLLETTAGLVHVKDKTGRYLFVNRAWAGCFDLDPDSVAGRTDDALLPPDLAAHLAAADRSVAEKLQPDQQIEVLEVAGKPQRFLFERFPMLDGGERLYALVSIATLLPDEPSDVPPPPSPGEPVAPAPLDDRDPVPEPPAPEDPEPAGSVAEPPAAESDPVMPSTDTPATGEPTNVPETATVVEVAETPVASEVSELPEILDLSEVPGTEQPDPGPDAEPKVEEKPEAEPNSAPKPSEPEPTSEPSAEPTSEPVATRKQAKRKAARKPRPQAETVSPQELLPGFTRPPVVAETPDSSDSEGRPVDLAEVASQMGVSPAEASERLATYVESQRRALRDLREALEDENEAEARALAHAIAEAAGDHGAPDLRRLAKTVELAVRFHEAHLPAMLGELETEADRVFAALEQLAAEDPAPEPKAEAKAEPEPKPELELEPEPEPEAAPEPPASLTLSTAGREVLEHLADLLEEEESEGAAEALEALLGQPLPEDLKESLVEVKGLIAEAELPEAEALVRGWLERLG